MPNTLEQNVKVEDKPLLVVDKEELKKLPPVMSSPEWEGYALSFFQPHELEQGRPKVHGLRRVVKLLLGSILKSKGEIKQSPTLENGQRASVEHTVVVYQTRHLEADEEPHLLEYTDVSDAWPENIQGDDFKKHPTSNSGTRSEARALRKLLGISTVAAEEIDTTPADNSIQGFASEGQITRIDLKCEELDVDVMKFINLGKKKYNRIEEVQYGVVQDMCKVLNEYDREVRPIPPQIKGYKINWRDKK